MTTHELPRERDELDGLVLAAREGDRHAFDELVRRTYVDTYTLARPAHGQRGGRARRGAGGLPAGLEGHLRRFRGDAQFTHVDVPDHREHRLLVGEASSPAPHRTARRRAHEPVELRADAQPGGGRRVGGRCSTGSRVALDELPAEAPGARRPEGRVRAVARGDRRGARDLGVGGEGAPAPWAQAAP